MIETASFMPADARDITVVHVTADYPDAIRPDKTPAIRQLVELVDDRFNQHVISLNRISPSVTELVEILLSRRSPLRSWVQHDRLTSAEYAAPGLGVLHKTMLLRLADAVSTKLAALPRPDLLVAHKLTVEGLVVAMVARRAGVPYAITLQGDTDTKIITARPDLAHHFAEVLHNAAVVFAMAPWALSDIQKRLKVSVRDPILLPCPVAIDSPIRPSPEQSGFISAFHLKNYRRKNFPQLCKAFDRAQQDMPGLGLTVCGGGSAEDHAQVAKISGRYRNIALAGAVLNSDLPARFNRSIGFVMPSLRETFGMAFIEALFAGCPVIYPSGRAIHGYFAAKPFALPIEPQDSGSIAAAILKCARDQTRIKTALAKWQHSGDAKRFQRATLRASFVDGLTRAASSTRGGAHKSSDALASMA